MDEWLTGGMDRWIDGCRLDGWMDGRFYLEGRFCLAFVRSLVPSRHCPPEAIHSVRMVHDREGGKHTLLLYNSYYDLEACNVIPKCFGAPERA